MGNGGAEPEQGNEKIEKKKNKPFLSPQKLKFSASSPEWSPAYLCESEKARSCDWYLGER